MIDMPSDTEAQRQTYHNQYHTITHSSSLALSHRPPEYEGTPATPWLVPTDSVARDQHRHTSICPSTETGGYPSIHHRPCVAPPWATVFEVRSRLAKRWYVEMLLH